MADISASLPGPRRRLWDFYTAPLALWTFFIAYSTLAPPSALPSVAFSVSDKLGHAALFSIFAALLLRAWVREGRIGAGAALGAVLIATIWGYYIECLQALTDYRDYDLRDLAADAIGAVAGIPLLLIFRSVVPRRTLALLLPFLMIGCAHSGGGIFGGAKFDQDYPAWSTVLARYVTDNGVDYAGLKDQRPLLDEALDAMRAVGKREFDGWSAATRLAFLANAHNAFAIDRILKAYPVASLAKTQSWTSARDARDIVLIGRKWSLHELADECMSDRYLDSRAIFLLNWAAVGCTPLPPVAVTENNINDLLDRQPRRFLADPIRCQYDPHGGVIYLSPLLDAFSEPIKRDYVTTWEFLKRYLPPDQAKQIAAVPPRIRWLDFDDALNDANLKPVARIENEETPPAAAPESAPPPLATPPAAPAPIAPPPAETPAEPATPDAPSRPITGKLD